MGISIFQVWLVWRGVDDEGLGRIMDIFVDVCVEQIMVKVQEIFLDGLLLCKVLWSLGVLFYYFFREILGEIFVNCQDFWLGIKK